MATYNWMSTTPDIDSLNICELTLPGTHNAGSDWRATYPLFSPPRHWLACQHDTFHAQLNHGARALDIRLKYEANGKGARKFVMHHGGYTNSRTLEDLANDINNFLAKNPDEFIILDFHELKGNDFDFEYFNNTIINLLGDRLVPRINQSLTLQELKRVSPKQRVFAAARSHWKLDYRVFHDQISHKWSENDITSPDELRQFIEKVMKNPPGTWNTWSLSATSFTSIGGPVDIHDQLNEWFDLDKSDWALKCNIINVDFMEESDLMEFCRVANVIKAEQRSL
ncbi:phosphatidylinositol-specific phospholipase C domain-containing protein [Pseudomonas sp. 3-2]|uniref:phosphatidylinositol-specific phospholipase C domain-containing protein n=1 Tax=Pseudomonas sp. 3-2 TaxID=2867408 RepID=UPI001C884285|nr:phosphatidylinositol-specific phospholipase C domain-containing protein [Pseudomonas sp. 3-2]QZD68502.1 phosphatidylinositol-specific phospholipase C domain-containing protein [Pseudomonas sp. 3-2]